MEVFNSLAVRFAFVRRTPRVGWSKSTHAMEIVDRAGEGMDLDRRR
jgi:hypothetical protein